MPYTVLASGCCEEQARHGACFGTKIAGLAGLAGGQEKLSGGGDLEMGLEAGE